SFSLSRRTQTAVRAVWPAQGSDDGSSIATARVSPILNSSSRPTSRQTRGTGLISGLSRYETIGTATTAPASPLSASETRLRKRRPSTCSATGELAEPAGQRPDEQQRAGQAEDQAGQDAERQQRDAAGADERPDRRVPAWPGLMLHLASPDQRPEVDDAEDDHPDRVDEVPVGR